jgi:sugar phosphate permease
MANELEKKMDEGATMRRDLRVSLCLLALLFALVLFGLAWDANWQKLLRVLIGFSAYIIVLLSGLGIYDLVTKRRAGLPFAAFALAGAAAEIGSGWLRPAARTAVDLSTALAAAILIGGVHWLALRYFRPLRERIIKKNELAPSSTKAI